MHQRWWYTHTPNQKNKEAEGVEDITIITTIATNIEVGGEEKQQKINPTIDTEHEQQHITVYTDSAATCATTENPCNKENLLLTLNLPTKENYSMP